MDLARVLGFLLLSVLLLGSCTAVKKSSRDYMIEGKRLYDSGDYAGALAEYTEAVRLYPSDFEPYFGRAWTLFRLDRLGESLVDFNKTIEINPGFPLAYQGRSLVGEKMGDLERAIADQKKYILLESGDHEAPVRLHELEKKYEKSRGRPASPVK